MKKIILSLAAIVFVGAVAAGATGAFFSDSETSTGNTFTAGAIDLKVDSTSHYAGLICTNNDGFRWTLENPQGTTTRPDLLGQICSGSWAMKDLVPGQDKFFNFSDVKPGDQGENTISLHIDNNSAYACADVTNVHNDDNTNLTPEVVAGDVTPGPIGGGELGANLDFLVWNDNGAGIGHAGNNIWDADEVGTNTSGGAPATSTAYTLADSTGLPIPPTGITYLGLAWCAGTFTAGGPGVAPVCDGSSMGNQAQTDSYTADIGLRVVQSRNNGNFTCGAPVVGVAAPTVVGANDLETVLANSSASGKWYFYDDTNDILNNTIGSFVAGPSIPPLGTGSAQMTATTSNSRVLLTNSGFGGTVLASTTALSYSYYQPSGIGSATEAPFLRFNVDFTSGSPAFQKSLVYVPADNGAVTQDSWQSTGNIAVAGAKWEYSGAFWPAGVTTVANTIAGTTSRTWASILADYPSIRMWATGPQIGVRVGEPGPAGLTANVDNFSITVNAVTKTYDFGN